MRKERKKRRIERKKETKNKNISKGVRKKKSIQRKKERKEKSFIGEKEETLIRKKKEKQ